MYLGTQKDAKRRYCFAIRGIFLLFIPTFYKITAPCSKFLYKGTIPLIICAAYAIAAHGARIERSEIAAATPNFNSATEYKLHHS